MNKLKLYSLSDEYVRFLRSDPKLAPHVRDNKEGRRTHTRKYLGVVLRKGNFKYFVPLVSPKDSDYILEDDGTRTIRKSVLPIIRVTAFNTRTKELELKGTIRFNNMIPVPDSELTPYFIDQETDVKYADVVVKEYSFIVKNRDHILKNADVLYNQKTNTAEIFHDRKPPNYLASVVDFLHAEQKCREYILAKERAETAPDRHEDRPEHKPSVRDRLAQLRREPQNAPPVPGRNERGER